jgi:hypothetical protein
MESTICTLTCCGVVVCCWPPSLPAPGSSREYIQVSVPPNWVQDMSDMCPCHQIAAKCSDYQSVPCRILLTCLLVFAHTCLWVLPRFLTQAELAELADKLFDLLRCVSSSSVPLSPFAFSLCLCYLTIWFLLHVVPPHHHPRGSPNPHIPVWQTWP